MANLKSRKALHAALVEIKASGLAPSLKLPESYKNLRNEVYGRKACIYLSYATLEERWTVEAELEAKGFKVSKTYSRVEGNCSKDSPSSEVEVSYFKGWHHDE